MKAEERREEKRRESKKNEKSGMNQTMKNERERDEKRVLFVEILLHPLNRGLHACLKNNYFVKAYSRVPFTPASWVFESKLLFIRPPRPRRSCATGTRVTARSRARVVR